MPISDFSKQIAKGSFWSLSGSIGLKLVSFAYMVIIARLVAQADIDTFYLVLSILGLLIIFADLGIGGAFVRYVPYFHGKNEHDKILMLLKFTYAMTTVFSVILAGIVFFSSDLIAGQFNNPNLAGTLRLFSPYILLTALFGLNTSFFNGMKKIMEQSSLLVFQNGAKLVLTVALLFFFGASLFSLTMGFLLSLLAALLLSFFMLQKPLGELAKSSKKQETGYRALLSDVIPFGIMISTITSFWLLINNTDRIMIGYFLPEGQVAVYTFATSLSMLIVIFPTAISSIFFPVVSELFGKGKKEEMVAVATTSLRWLLFIIMPLSIVMFLFPDNLLEMFYGSEYASGGMALAIFTFGLLIRSISSMHGIMLAGMRLVRIELKIAAIAALANVALNLFLIPRFGIEGAAAASAVAFLITTALFIHFSNKFTGFSLSMDVFKSILAGLLAFALIFFAKPYLAQLIDIIPFFEGDLASTLSKIAYLAVLGVLFIIAGFVYLAALLLLKAFKEEDLLLLAAALRRAKVPEYLVTNAMRLLSVGNTRR